jgi:putative membrane-bound dehydrogenase-like protein
MLVARIVVCVAALGFAGDAWGQTKHPLRTFSKQTLSQEFFCEGASYGDFNKDGKMDLVAGPFWFEGPDFSKKHEYYTPKPFDPGGYSDNFFAFTGDFSGDGWTDILIYGFPGKDASWFENPQGKDGHWTRHMVMPTVDNESPTFLDITGDGQPEIICSTGGFFGYATYDPKDAKKPWPFRVISDKSAGGMFTHGLGVGDVNGDGKLDLLEKNGWWEQPASLDGDPIWKKHAFNFSQGGSHMFAYDVNGDGRSDVITALQAHGYGLVWWEQTGDKAEPTFEQHVITGAKASDNPYGVVFSQPHAVDLVDMNGDGLLDIISGKRWWAHGPKGDAEPNAAAVVYWFELKRDGKGEVDWVPHLADDDSGIGTQIIAGDFSGDGNPDIVVGNKKGIFALTQVVKEVSKEEFDAAQPKKRPEMASGLSPKEAAAAMSVPPGFSVKLFAGEPDVQQPIAMSIDDRGRLWIAEAYTYPIRLPEGEGKDRILIFEDADNDGAFDKRTVFKEGLNLVSGIEVGFGGVWVGTAPYLMFIPDADADDKPDGEPQILLDGWGYQDTHETLNSFIWGPDGWLYGCHGVFTHSRVGKPGTVDEKRVPINAGIWRYHPTRHEFEVFAEGTSNPWGVDFNDKGDAFCTACVIPHLYHMIPGARYQRQAGSPFNPYTYDDIKTIAKHRHFVGGQWNDADRLKSDAIGGGHAHAGAMIYQGGQWPERYRNQIFMNNIHGARLNLDLLTAKGSGYEGDGAPDFLFANDIWSQFIYLTYGPDGQVYVIDWYDKNQCHHGNTGGHDRTNGRIFKICYGKSEGLKADLKSLSDAELIALQTHKNEWYVRHARRILQERAAKKADPATLQALYNAFEKAKRADRFKLLLAVHAYGGINDYTIPPLLTDEDPTIRAWGVRFIGNTNPPQKGGRGKAMEALVEKEAAPSVRLALCSTLQKLPAEERWPILAKLVSHAEDAGDHNLPLMIWYAVEPLVIQDPEQALRLAEVSQIPLVSRFIVRRAAADDLAYDALFATLQKATDAQRPWMLEETVAALKLRGRVAMPAAWEKTFESLMKLPDETVKQQAEFIAVKFGDRRVFETLRKTLSDSKLDLDRRKLALDSLVVGKDEELPPVLYGLLKDEAIRTSAINALAAFDQKETPAVLIDAYTNLPPADKQAAIAVLSGRPQSVLELMTAMEKGRIPRNDLTAFTVRQIARLNNEEVTRRLNEVWGTLRDTPADKVADMKKYKSLLRADRLKDSNPSHGRELFNKTCAACHTLFGSGKQIGPDITGSNRANMDYLLENLLDPSAVVGRDYQMTIFALSDGRVLNGIVRQELNETVTIQTPTEQIVLPKADIEERKLSSLSLMPEGQLKQLSEGDVCDLVAYLNSAGQVPLPGDGPYMDPKTRKVAGAIEGETLRVVSKTGGNLGTQGMSGFPLGKWSGNEHLWWTGGKPGDKAVVSFTIAEPGTYELFLVGTKAVDYGEVQVSIDGKPVTGKIDFYNEGVVNSAPISLGSHSFPKGEQQMTIEITGANAKAVKGYMFAIDYLWLKKAS